MPLNQTILVFDLFLTCDYAVVVASYNDGNFGEGRFLREANTVLEISEV